MLLRRGLTFRVIDIGAVVPSVSMARGEIQSKKLRSTHSEIGWNGPYRVFQHYS